jgi:hypothetical protein
MGCHARLSCASRLPRKSPPGYAEPGRHREPAFSILRQPIGRPVASFGGIASSPPKVAPILTT